MILVDVNLLVYAHVAGFPQHEAARAWLDERLNGATRMGLPWSSLVGFLRIVMSGRVFERPEPIDAAWEQVQEWLAAPAAWVPSPTERHPHVLGGLLRTARPCGNLVPDAHLAALAIAHGLVLCSTDGDFARFPDLRWENPLRS